MSLVLRIIESPEGEAVTEWQKTFPDDGGSIGRSTSSTLVLSDASRTISKTHALVVRVPSGFRIIDTSINGLYINGSSMPLGNQNQALLTDGDVMDIGGYRLLVSCFEPATAKVKKSPLQSWKEYDPFDLKSAQDGHDKFDKNITDSTRHEKQSENNDNTQIEQQDLCSSGKVTVESDPFTDIPDAAEPDVSSSVSESSDEIRHDFGMEDNGFFAARPLQTGYQMNEKSVVFDQVSDYDTDVTVVSASKPGKPYTKIKNEGALSVSQSDSIDDRVMLIIETAFNQFLEDISPQALEDMAMELSCSNNIFHKKNYWKFYSALHRRQKETKDWLIRFKSYLAESHRLMY